MNSSVTRTVFEDQNQHKTSLCLELYWHTAQKQHRDTA